MGFEKMNSKVLKAPVGPGREVLARRGAMLGYTGDVRFSPVRSGGGSVGGFLGSQLSGESAAMMVAQGSGEVYYGFQGLTYAVVDLSVPRCSPWRATGCSCTMPTSTPRSCR